MVVPKFWVKWLESFYLKYFMRTWGTKKVRTSASFYQKNQQIKYLWPEYDSTCKELQLECSDLVFREQKGHSLQFRAS